MEVLLRLLDATPNVKLDENAVDDGYPDYVYGEDDGAGEYEELYDDGVNLDVNAEVQYVDLLQSNLPFSNLKP